MVLAYTPNYKISADTIAFDQGALEKLYRLLYDATGVDFSKYKPGTINRRIYLSMQECGIENLDEYCDHVLKNPEALGKLFHRLLIPVTSFFRYPKLYAVLKNEILQLILPKAAERGTLRIWCLDVRLAKKFIRLQFVWRRN